MEEELERFFKSIHFEAKDTDFQKAYVKKVIYLKQKDVFEIYLHLSFL